MLSGLPLAARSARGIDGTELRLEGLEENPQVTAQQVADIPQLDRAQSPDPAFDVTDERLRPTGLVGQRLLGDTGLHPELAQVSQQDFVFGSVDGLGHGHGLTAWLVTLYLISRYLNFRFRDRGRDLSGERIPRGRQVRHDEW